MALINFEKSQKERDKLKKLEEKLGRKATPEDALEMKVKEMREAGPMPQPGGLPAPKKEFEEFHGRVHDHDRLFRTP